ncbi:unnamed protein product [Colias eurytheme]|nr:unnamed protein product [Colias eurytheme]
MTKCCVIGCKNVGIHKFPINPTIRRKWIAAVRIKNFEPKKTTRLCRDHFHENDYQSLSVTTGLPCAHKFLKKDAVPSLFSWNQKKISASACARDERHAKRNLQKDLFQQQSSEHPSTSSE